MVAQSHPLADSIVVLNIATNKYFEYWKQLVESAEAYTVQEDQVQFWLFTDQSEEAKLYAKKFSNISVQVFEIPSLGWPDATLLRYEIFLEQVFKSHVDIFVYLDVDMLITKNPWSAIRENLSNSEICLVEHPGYWRPKGRKGVMCYLLNPRLLLRDGLLLLEFGALGKWEINKNSTAYVPRSLRKHYFCGGIWFGRQNAIRQMISQLASNVKEDSSRGLMAVWHDESHLNQWAVNNKHNSESPRLCFDETYSHLMTLDPLIHAVRKPVTDFR
jgi:hypothetical protein